MRMSAPLTKAVSPHRDRGAYNRAMPASGRRFGFQSYRTASQRPSDNLPAWEGASVGPMPAVPGRREGAILPSRL